MKIPVISHVLDRLKELEFSKEETRVFLLDAIQVAAKGFGEGMAKELTNKHD